MGYDNYINRYDLGGGIDFGRETERFGDVYLGLRHGYIHQGDQGGQVSNRSSHYTRVLFGYAGQLHERLTARLEVGPSRYDYKYGPGDTRITRLYFDATVTAQLTERDQLVFRAAERQWVSSTGLLSNRDITYGLSWLHKNEANWDARLGFLARGLNYDGRALNDWMYALSTQINYNWRPNWQLGFEAEVSRGRDEKLGRDARAYDRTWVGIFCRWQL